MSKTNHEQTEPIMHSMSQKIKQILRNLYITFRELLSGKSNMATALAMESNPETMNRYMHRLGVPEQWKMVDVIGLEEDVLNWVPRPVLAVVLLFPLSDVYEEHQQQQETELANKSIQAPKNVFHMKQILSNVCGTMALVHSVANNVHRIELYDGLLKKYLNDAEGLDASAKGALLENTTGILEAYKDVVNSSAVAESNEPETDNNHFVTFIHKDGILFELDGRKTYPINHGATTADSLLEDAAKICREFIAREPNNIGFNVVALVPAE